jgi:hypothetical protein
LNDVGSAIHDTFFAVPGSAAHTESTQTTSSGMMAQSMGTMTQNMRM